MRILSAHAPVYDRAGKVDQEEDNQRALQYAKKLDDEEKARELKLEKLALKSKGSQQMYLKASDSL